MTIGDIIQRARLKLGFTQQYVGKMLGVGRSAVHQWENGGTKPNITNRARLAVLLNVRMADLVPGSPVDEITEEIAEIVRAVHPSKQAALVIVIEQVAKSMSDPPPESPPRPPPRRTKPKRDL